MPQYAAIIYSATSTGRCPSTPTTTEEYTEFGEAAAAVIRGGAALYPTSTATTVRVKGGKGGDVVTTDGPYAETKEALTGFYLLECADLDEAIELAAQIPGAWDGAVEVRPVIDFGGVSASTRGAVAADALAAWSATRAGARARHAGPRHRRPDLAEDAVQDAVVRALETWPRDGVPDEPAGLADHAARRRAIDLHPPRGRARREGGRRRCAPARRPADDPPPETVARRPAAAGVHLLPPGARRSRRRWR